MFSETALLLTWQILLLWPCSPAEGGVKWHYNSIDPATWNSWNGSLSCPVALELRPAVALHRRPWCRKQTLEAALSSIRSLLRCKIAGALPDSAAAGVGSVSRRGGAELHRPEHKPGAHRCPCN
jgi:hypothetical protein